MECKSFGATNNNVSGGHLQYTHGIKRSNYYRRKAALHVVGELMAIFSRMVGALGSDVFKIAVKV